MSFLPLSSGRGLRNETSCICYLHTAYLAFPTVLKLRTWLPVVAWGDLEAGAGESSIAGLAVRQWGYGILANCLRFVRTRSPGSPVFFRVILKGMCKTGLVKVRVVW